MKDYSFWPFGPFSVTSSGGKAIERGTSVNTKSHRARAYTTKKFKYSPGDCTRFPAAAWQDDGIK